MMKHDTDPSHRLCNFPFEYNNTQQQLTTVDSSDQH